LTDYRTVQGVKQPFHSVASRDGVKTDECDVTELKLYEKPLDEKLFSNHER
jgi:hypothetical protein